MHHKRVINEIANTIHAESYLEIGCLDNETFAFVDVPLKVGVDPNSGGTLRMTSDDFFKLNQQGFDLVFIDGDHHEEQVFRDIQNALACLNLGGVVLVHDTLPENFDVTVKGCGPYWTGDGWKAVCRLVDHEFRTVDFSTGLTAIRQRKTERGLASPVTWSCYESRRDEMMQVVSMPDFLKFACDLDFGVVYIHTGGCWKEIQERSQESLPKSTLVEVFEVEDLHEHRMQRLDLINDLPFSRTLYLDSDTLYFQETFPEWITQRNESTGLWMSDWNRVCDSWKRQGDQATQLLSGPGAFSHFDEVIKVPRHVAWPQAGVMVIEKQAKKLFQTWRKHWEQGMLLEPAFVKAFSRTGQNFDILEQGFHLPSLFILNPRVPKLNQYHFVHMIGPDKMQIADQVEAVLL